MTIKIKTAKPALSNVLASPIETNIEISHDEILELKNEMLPDREDGYKCDRHLQIALTLDPRRIYEVRSW